MDIMDEIKNSINSNMNLDQLIKEKLFEMIIIFHNKFPNINLNQYNALSKTVKIGRIGKYETRGVSVYDAKDNAILFSPNRLKLDYNLDNLFMRATLGMITSTGKYSGFNSEPDLLALNSAYEEILANYLVGTSEISDQEEEMVITNLVGIVIGEDILFNAYFANDGELIKNEIKTIEENK